MDEAIAESSIPDESENVASASYEHYFFVFSIGNFLNYLLTTTIVIFFTRTKSDPFVDESTNRFVRVKNNIFLYTEVNFLILLKYNFILVDNRVAW